MTYKQVCRLCFLGIDDELKNDASSVYTTNINSSFSLFLLLLLLQMQQSMRVKNMGSKLLHSLKKPTQNE
jgi:hypothetical protein